MRAKKIAEVRLSRRACLLMVVFSLTLLFAGAPGAHAHRVYLYAWVEGDTVYTESYFGSKKKVRGGLVQVYDPAGNKLLEGRTNNEGMFSFGIPQKTDLRIVVEASMGHKGEYTLKAEEFADVPGEELLPTQTREDEEPSPSNGSSLDAAQIRAIIEQSLDSRLRPIIRELAQSRKEKGPGLREIGAGIGYIVGLMGLVMYWRSRKK